MCIIYFAYEMHPQYRLVLAGNRDEFYKRPTSSAGFWEDYPDILAGRDLEKMGTWLGISRNGRLGAITNYRNLKLLLNNPISRGEIIKKYLIDKRLPREFLEEIKSERNFYDPFNLLLWYCGEMFYYSNIENEIKRLSPGIYGLSNALLDTPWPKVVRGKELFMKVIGKDRIDGNELLDILGDRKIPRDHELPDTGMGIKWERVLSPIFIKSDTYGTRASTVILIDKDNKVTFLERSLRDTEKDIWSENKYQFKIQEGK